MVVVHVCGDGACVVMVRVYSGGVCVVVVVVRACLRVVHFGWLGMDWAICVWGDLVQGCPPGRGTPRPRRASHSAIWNGI